MRAPVFDIAYDPITCGALMHVEDGIESFHPVLLHLMGQRFLGTSMNKENLYEMKCFIGSCLYSLMQSGYLIPCSCGWNAHIVQFVEDTAKINAFMCYPNNVLAKCLMDGEGNLSHKTRLLSAEKIEALAQQLNDKSFNEAVEKYKDEIILQVAGIQ